MLITRSLDLVPLPGDQGTFLKEEQMSEHITYYIIPFLDYKRERLGVRMRASAKFNPIPERAVLTAEDALYGRSSKVGDNQEIYDAAKAVFGALALNGVRVELIDPNTVELRAQMGQDDGTGRLAQLASRAGEAVWNIFWWRGGNSVEFSHAELESMEVIRK